MCHSSGPSRMIAYPELRPLIGSGISGICKRTMDASTAMRAIIISSIRCVEDYTTIDE